MTMEPEPDGGIVMSARDGERRRPPSGIRRAAVYLGVSSFAFISYISAVRYAAHTDSSPRTAPPPEFRYGLELRLTRGDERMLEGDTSRPFRASTLTALETTTASGVAAPAAPPFAARSRSTARHRPEPTDIASYYKEPNPQKRDEEPAILWGFTEIPAGVYWVRAVARESGIGLLISDVGRIDGRIATSEPVTLFRTPVDFAPGTSPTLAVARETTVGVRFERGGCYFHATPTREWSHRDAMGCVSIYSPRRGGTTTAKPDEWRRLVTLLEARGLVGAVNPSFKLTVIDGPETTAGTGSTKGSDR